MRNRILLVAFYCFVIGLSGCEVAQESAPLAAHGAKVRDRSDTTVPEVPSAPLFSGHVYPISSGGKTISAIEIQSGTVSWEFRAPGNESYFFAHYSKGYVFLFRGLAENVGSRNNYLSYDAVD